jgi:hypothetical protein
MIVGICWYLSGLFLLASLLNAMISVPPENQKFVLGSMIVCIIASLLFAAMASFLHTRTWPWIRRSRLAKNIFFVLAGLLTAIIVPVIVG